MKMKWLNLKLGNKSSKFMELDTLMRDTLALVTVQDCTQLWVKTPNEFEKSQINVFNETNLEHIFESFILSPIYFYWG